MKQFILIFSIVLIGNFSYSQIHYDGLLHEPVGNVTMEFEDTLSLVSNNVEEVSGVDIVLGDTKGFGFTFAAINPVLSPNEAYQEWRMIGTLDGQENQLLWTERHQVVKQDGLIATSVLFDTGPLNSEGNVLRIFKNKEKIYEAGFGNGPIYSILIDTSIVPYETLCKHIFYEVVWDNTCVVKNRINFSRKIILGEGTIIDLDAGDLLEIETFASNPTVLPTSCSKVESRSQNMEQGLFYDEGIIMFDDKIPFYAIGEILIETSPEYLKILEIDNNGLSGVNIPLDNANKFDLNWMPIVEPGENYAIEISSKGIVNQEEKTLGKVVHQANSEGQFSLNADFSDFDTESKTIQIVNDGEIVQEFLDFNSNEVAILDRIPNGCGKLDQEIFDPFDLIFILCYYLEFDDLTDFEILGEIYQGNEIRILSNSKVPVDGLSEFSVLLSDVNEFIITDANSIVSSVNEFSNLEADFIDVYPSPVTNYLNLSNLEDIDGFNFLIFDNHGEVVKKGSLDSRSLDVTSLNSGIFYLKLYSNSKIFRSKFLKIH